MSKEYLEALEIIKKDIYDYYNDYIDDITIIEKALQRLEAIENSNPSEALKCLEKIEDTFGCDMTYYHSNSLNTIKQALIKAQEKVLEIIKEKNVDMSLLKDSDNVEDYNFLYTKVYGREEEFELTEEEFELLKR